MRLHKDAKIDLLKNVPLFAGCSKSELQRIASLADELDLGEGATLIREGERGREFIVDRGGHGARDAQREAAPRARRGRLHRRDRARRGRAAHGDRDGDVAGAPPRRHRSRVPRPARADAVDREEGRCSRSASGCTRTPFSSASRTQTRICLDSRGGTSAQASDSAADPRLRRGRSLKASASRPQRRRASDRRRATVTACTCASGEKPSQIDQRHVPPRGKTTRAR